MIPINGFVLMEVLPTETTTPGGILLTEAAAGRSNRGKVKTVSKGTWTKKGVLVEPRVRRDDVVLFDPYRIAHVVGERSVASMHAKAGDLVLIHERDVFGVFEGESAA